ncbi:MAG TPA: Crp/Fnr family transcriptional regulator [Streptosporangiaceae bacterium]
MLVLTDPPVLGLVSDHQRRAGVPSDPSHQAIHRFLRPFNPSPLDSLLVKSAVLVDDSKTSQTDGMDMHKAESRKEFWHLLTDSEQSALTALGRITTFPPGATMCVEGEPATHVFVVKTGWVKISCVTPEGNELLLALRGQGDIVGEWAGEANGYRAATVRAVDTVHTLIILYGNFASFLNGHPGADRAYHRVVTRGWQDTAAMLRSQANTNGSERLAALLIDLAIAHGTVMGGVVEIEFPLSQEELASLACASRATVTRALGDWRRRGFVRTGHRHITIIDMEGLRRIAHRLNPGDKAWDEPGSGT